MHESAAAAGVTTKSQFENYYRWVEPDSDITVCLKLETVDRLQLDVLRGLHSFAHAGNEVGGILLGRTDLDEGRTITFVEDFEPVACDHRNGPSYALTAKDAVNFEAALQRCGGSQGPSVVGYYRSHNRDGLFLSLDDLRIIQRHFRGPDNVFLLIKTLPNGACTAGFFFWKDGRIQSEFTDSEAPLIPISFSSTGRSLSLDAVDDIPVAPAPELGRSPNLHRRLIRGMVFTGVAAAVTVAVVRYRETEPSAPPPVSVPVATTPNLRIPKAALPQTQNKPAETPALRSSVANEPSRVLLANTIPSRDREGAVAKSTEPSTPASSTPLTAATESPLNTTPPAPVETPPALVETAMAPPIQVKLPSVPDKPPTPAVEAQRTDATTRVVPPISTPAPPAPPAASPAHTFVSPQVIHQVTPAVPRGVGPMIMTDVQIDVAVAIDPNGKVTGARVASTKGTAAGLLTVEALKAAQLFRFQPAQENNRNVPSSMVLTFRFARTAK
jgi:TonB family protein